MNFNKQVFNAYNLLPQNCSLIKATWISALRAIGSERNRNSVQQKQCILWYRCQSMQDRNKGTFPEQPKRSWSVCAQTDLIFWWNVESLLPEFYPCKSEIAVFIPSPLRTQMIKLKCYFTLKSCSQPIYPSSVSKPSY